MVLEPEIQPECENQCNGAIYLAIIGGSNSYIHEVTFWGNDDGAVPCDWAVNETVELSSSTILETLENLEWGNYHIVTTDKESGCTVEGDYFVEEIPSTGPFMVVGEPITTKSCPDQATGTISITLSGGFPPYTIELNNGMTVSSVDETSPATLVFENVWAGEYATLRIRDKPECESILDNITGIKVEEHEEIKFNLIEMKEACPGFSFIEYSIEGGALVDGSNQFGPYYVKWTADNGFYEEFSELAAGTNLILDGLFEGNYTVEIKDVEGCSQTFEVEVEQYDEPTLTMDEIIGVACPSYTSTYIDEIGLIGSIQITVTTDPENTAYTVNWNTGETAEFINGLTVGSYTVSITNGCSGNPDFSPTGTEVISNGTISTQPVGGQNCFNYVYCGGEMIDIDWSGYEIENTINNDEICQVILRCENGNSVTVSGVENTIGFEGGTNGNGDCFCREELECSINETLYMYASFIHPNGTSYIESDLGFEPQTQTAVNAYETYIQPANNQLFPNPMTVGQFPCNDNELLVNFDCGTGDLADLDICDQCLECIPNESNIESVSSTGLEGSSCTVMMFCGSGSNQILTTLTGTTIINYNDEEDSGFDCFEWCNEGNICVGTVLCKVDGFAEAAFFDRQILNTASDDTGDSCGDVMGDFNNDSVLDTVPGTTVNYFCPPPLSTTETPTHSYCSPTGFPNVWACGDAGMFGSSIVDPLPTSPCGPTLIPYIQNTEINDAGHETTYVMTEIFDKDDFSVNKVFPNPISQNLTIHITASYAGVLDLRVINNAGRQLISKKEEITKGFNHISLSLSSINQNGIYYLHIVDEHQNTFVHRLIKSN